MKPTQLESASRWALNLHRTRDSARDGEWDNVRGVRHETPDGTGRIRVSGHSGLKGSQEYPKRYGEEVVHQFLQHRGTLEAPDVEDNGSSHIDWDRYIHIQNVQNADWSAARLDEVARFLEIPLDRPL